MESDEVLRIAAESWERIPYFWKAFIWGGTTIALTVALIKLSQFALKQKTIRRTLIELLESGYGIYLSAKHNYGHLIGRVATSSGLIGVGVSGTKSYYTNYPIHHSHFFWMSLAVGVGPHALEAMGIRKLAHPEHSIFFKNRAETARLLYRYTSQQTPKLHAGTDYSKDPEVREYIQSILENHLKFLHRTLRLGFSRHGKEIYSASLLFYDRTKQEWVRWGTFYESNHPQSQVRTGSKWPKLRKDFALDDSLYKDDGYRRYFTAKVKGQGYQSVLIQPLYFRSDVHIGKKLIGRRGETFGAITYTNTNPNSFNKLTPDRHLHYFAFEAALIERMAFRIYRSYNF